MSKAFVVFIFSFQIFLPKPLKQIFALIFDKSGSTTINDHALMTVHS